MARGSSGGSRAAIVTVSAAGVCVGARRMTEHAEVRNPTEAAAAAVKTYIRLHRETLSAVGELLALLLPERFGDSDVRDLQQHVIEKLRGENAALRAERDGLKGARDQ